MHALLQSDIDHLDEIASRYSCELLLPPVLGSDNICIHTGGITDLTLLHEALFFEGYSFIQKMQEGLSFIEIIGIYHES
jgi:hypothetical protein